MASLWTGLFRSMSDTSTIPPGSSEKKTTHTGGVSVNNPGTHSSQTSKEIPNHPTKPSQVDHQPPIASSPPVFIPKSPIPRRHSLLAQQSRPSISLALSRPRNRALSTSSAPPASPITPWPGPYMNPPWAQIEGKQPQPLRQEVSLMHKKKADPARAGVIIPPFLPKMPVRVVAEEKGEKALSIWFSAPKELITTWRVFGPQNHTFTIPAPPRKSSLGVGALLHQRSGSLAQAQLTNVFPPGVARNPGPRRRERVPVTSVCRYEWMIVFLDCRGRARARAYVEVPGRWIEGRKGTGVGAEVYWEENREEDGNLKGLRVVLLEDKGGDLELRERGEFGLFERVDSGFSDEDTTNPSGTRKVTQSTLSDEEAEIQLRSEQARRWREEEEARSSDLSLNEANEEKDYEKQFDYRLHRGSMG